MSCYLKDLLLALPMEQPWYMRINLKRFPPDIVQWYNIHEKVSIDGYIYIKFLKECTVWKKMYCWRTKT